MALFRGVTNASYSGGNTTSYVVNKPTGTVDGDFMVMFWFDNSSTIAPTTLAGWTLLRSDSYNGATSSCSVYYKVASGEGSSYTWACTNTRAAQCMMSFYGINTTVPASTWDGQSFSDNASSTTITGSAITVNGGGEAIIWFGGYNQAAATRTVTVPTNYTDNGAVTVDNGSTIYTGFKSAYLLNPGTGSTGSVNGTLSLATAGCCYVLSIKGLSGYPLFFGSL